MFRGSPIKYYLILAALYFCMAAGVVMLTRDDGVYALKTAWTDTVALVPVFGQIVLGLLCAGIVISRLSNSGSLKTVVSAVLMAFVATLMFHSGFTLFKTSMPYITPFYADIALADWDRALHGGRDAWEITYAWAEFLPVQQLLPFYLHIWVWPAICLPVFVAAVDKDRARVMRTLTMYVLAWVLIGNVFALLGMSAGPVFYDRIYGGERFAELTAAMAAAPELSAYFVSIQDDLWMAYSTSGQTIGTGISAFPSVHLSISMVAALYMWERGRWLGVIGAGFVVVILFLSVFSGYHYGLDGYFSIVVMWSVWALMRRCMGLRNERQAQGVSMGHLA